MTQVRLMGGGALREVSRKLVGLSLRVKCSVAAGFAERILSREKSSRAFWTLGAYSLAKTLRHSLGLPRGFRLAVSTDHGVQLASVAVPEEEGIPSSVHLTWSAWRNTPSFSKNKRTILIEHPWIAYRKHRGYAPKPDAKGSLVFLSHSVPKFTPAMQSIGEFLEHVEKLPDEYRPFTFSVHMHDIRLGLHNPLLSRGYKVVTAGSVSSPLFVDRFYRNLAQAERAISVTIGSQLFLAEEFGIPSVLHPRPCEPVLGNVVDSIADLASDLLVERVVDSFNIASYNKRAVQRASLLREVLSLGVNSSAAQTEMKAERAVVLKKRSSL